jgi:hypothetical protein
MEYNPKYLSGEYLQDDR